MVKNVVNIALFLFMLIQIFVNILKLKCLIFLLGQSQQINLACNYI